MKNSQMKAGRFLKLHIGRKLIKKIIDCLSADGIVMISTYTRHVQYDKRHVDMFKVNKVGTPLVQRGKNWDDISGCAFKFYSKKTK